MLIVSFIFGSLLALAALVIIMITSAAKAQICKAEYMNQQVHVCVAQNKWEMDCLTIQRGINELVRIRYPTCSWRYDGNKLDLPLQHFIDIEILTQEGNHFATERIARNSIDNSVEHCEAF